MAEAGFPVAELRCAASNRRARSFYRANGWTEMRTYAHEVHGDLMVDFEKRMVPT